MAPRQPGKTKTPHASSGAGLFIWKGRDRFASTQRLVFGGLLLALIACSPATGRPSASTSQRTSSSQHVSPNPNGTDAATPAADASTRNAAARECTLSDEERAALDAFLALHARKDHLFPDCAVWSSFAPRLFRHRPKSDEWLKAELPQLRTTFRGNMLLAEHQLLKARDIQGDLLPLTYDGQIRDPCKVKSLLAQLDAHYRSTLAFLEDALSPEHRASADRSELVEGLTRLGLQQEMMGHLEEARQSFGELVSMGGGSNKTAYYNLARTYLHRPATRESLQAALAALRRSYPVAWARGGWPVRQTGVSVGCYIAEIEAWLGRPKQALRVVDQLARALGDTPFVRDLRTRVTERTAASEAGGERTP